jgi:hypothetical protein
MIQFPTISPAKGHLASILSTHLTAGADFSVAPEITANLVEMVEIGSNNLTQKAASSLWMDAGEFRQREFESISKSRFVERVIGSDEDGVGVFIEPFHGRYPSC